ncbi:MAG: 30S ribosome-binding factor RbfA [Proteobacteria bacterium]|nr:30S ribosome-binding factor RbfA [Pseudomonadota bacterium]
MNRDDDNQGGPSQRQLRVGEALRRALTEVLLDGHFRDPDLQGVSVTVSEVRSTPDLKHATAFVTTLGGANVETTIAALGRARAYIRGEIARRVDLRQAPEWHFRRDTAFDHAETIGRALRDPKVAMDVAPAKPAPKRKPRKK